LRGTAARPAERPATDGRAGLSGADRATPRMASAGDRHIQPQYISEHSMNTQPHDHILKSHDDERRIMLDEILRMGEMAAAQLEAALDVIDRRDAKAAERIIANDEAIDALELRVSHDAMKLALRGPLARDLREILSALRIASDIERIGDYASNIAKRSMALNLSPPLPHTRGLGSLGRLVLRQVRKVLVAYRDSDANAAQEVRAEDAEVDAQYTGLFRELLTYMMEDPRVITPCTHLLFMAKNLERVGDHATNIAENIWFQEYGEGQMPPRVKRDETSSAV
jgi:phosphate transport system protein